MAICVLCVLHVCPFCGFGVVGSLGVYLTTSVIEADLALQARSVLSQKLSFPTALFSSLPFQYSEIPRFFRLDHFGGKYTVPTSFGQSGFR